MNKPLRHLDLFSGYGGFSIAMERVGFVTAAFAEIEKFPCAILKHHWPDVPNLGDVTHANFIRKARAAGPFDIVTFGSPCQGFSIAGKRLGLDDPRSNLALHALRIVQKLKPRWFILENVPGLRSSANGDDFGIFLRLVAECGYYGAWRSLDAQFSGVPQRRERIFFVGCAGDWRGPATILFEPESMRRYFAPRREAGQGIAGTIAARTKGGGGLGTDFDCDGGLISHTLNAKGGSGRIDGESETFVCAPPLTGNPYGDHESREGLLVTHSLSAEGFDASENGTGRGTPIIAFSAKDHGADAGELAPTLRAGGHTKSHANAGVMPAIAFDLRGRDGGSMPEGQHGTANIRASNGGSSRSYIAASSVRRLTPLECERLQGVPDGWTAVTYRGKPAADGPRYKAIGNGVAVPVVEWIAARIAQYEKERARARSHKIP